MDPVNRPTPRLGTNGTQGKRRMAIYVRRSVDDGDATRSLPEQERECRRHAEKLGGDVVSVFSENASGVTGEDRPRFVAMIEAAERGEFDVIVVLDVSRFGRFGPDERGYWLHRLRRAGVEVAHVLDGDALSGPAGPVVGAVLQVAANDHSRKTGYKAVLGQLAAMERGHWPGGTAPYGYRLQRRDGWDGKGRADTRLVIHEPEAAVVRRIYEDYASGRGYVAIVRALTEEGVPGPSGRSWCTSTVRHMVKSPVYCGDLVRGPGSSSKFYSGTSRGVVPVAERADADPVVSRGVLPAIVSREVWEKAQAVADAKCKTPTGGRPLLLTGIVRCRLCGGPLVSDGSGGPNRYRYAVCSRGAENGDRGGCARVRVRADKLEAAVLTEVRAEASRADPERIASEVRRMIGDAPSPTACVASLEARRRRLDERRRTLALSDEDDDVIRAALADIAAESRRLSQEVERARAAEGRAANVNALVALAVAAARQVAAPETEEGRAALRELLKRWVPRLEVGPSEPHQPRPVTMTVLTIEGLASTGTVQLPGAEPPREPRDLLVRSSACSSRRSCARRRERP
jgi:DNA invertase Pin-like site-specific DNA recombinase